ASVSRSAGGNFFTVGLHRFFSRIGGVFVCGRSRVCVALDSVGKTGRRAGSLWLGKYRPIRGGFFGPGDCRFGWMATRVSRRGNPLDRVGNRLRLAGSESARSKTAV